MNKKLKYVKTIKEDSSYVYIKGNGSWKKNKDKGLQGAILFSRAYV
jgi:hypothetical protein